jgi:hypothetical protein
LYIVTCEMREEGDYAAFRERLRTLDARQILTHVWALRTTYTAAQLKDLLRGYLATGDSILVAEVGAEWASRRALRSLGEL